MSNMFRTIIIGAWITKNLKNFRKIFRRPEGTGFHWVWDDCTSRLFRNNLRVLVSVTRKTYLFARRRSLFAFFVFILLGFNAIVYQIFSISKVFRGLTNSKRIKFSSKNFQCEKFFYFTKKIFFFLKSTEYYSFFLNLFNCLFSSFWKYCENIFINYISSSCMKLVLLLLK